MLCTACGSGSPPPRLVTSRYEPATGHRIVRDCGIQRAAARAGAPQPVAVLRHRDHRPGRPGARLPDPGRRDRGRGPYTPGRGRARRADAGDTGVGQPAAAPAGPAAVAPARTAPEPFLPVPASLTCRPARCPAPGRPSTRARWVTGATREPGSSGHVLISYADYCVSGPTVHPRGGSAARLRPGGQRAGATGQVFPRRPAGSSAPTAGGTRLPVFGGGYLYLFGRAGTVREPGRGLPGRGRAASRRVVGQRVQLPVLDRPRLVRTALADACRLTGAVTRGACRRRLPGTPGGGSSAWSSRPVRGGRLQRLAGDGAHRALAANPDRPGPVPGGEAGRPARSGLCRALIGHPELSTPDDLLISFFHPGTNHVEVAALPVVSSY